MQCECHGHGDMNPSAGTYVETRNRDQVLLDITSPKRTNH